MDSPGSHGGAGSSGSHGGSDSVVLPNGPAPRAAGELDFRVTGRLQGAAAGGLDFGNGRRA